MSFLGKLRFWKKDDDLGIGDTGNIPGIGALSPDGGMQGNMAGNLPEADHLGLDRSTDKLVDTTGFEPISSVENPASLQQRGGSYEEVKQGNSVPGGHKELDLISSKLDTIKAELDSMNQRLQKIEKYTEQGHVDKEEKRTVW